ncbi:PoNe immunity protein domain-containing protein [Streptococcus respiraculi]|uniref:PoNe immunity protein domain-containing protein n=1 Tax=Streptococcus respiraculi TaxID=2021971 RepID=UPI0013C423DF|nr:PoNe immunity protein domain-containing protein [Streptococcus respiraculi]
MRDRLQTKEYFEQFILESQMRVDTADGKILSLLNGEEVRGNLSILRDTAFQSRFEILLARYSLGEGITEIKNSFLQSISAFENKYEPGNYSVYLQYIALSTLLNVDDNIRNRIHTILLDKKTDDAFYNFLLFGEFEGRQWKFIEKYKDIIEADSDSRIELVERLLSKWYVRNKSSYWYNSHKATNRCLYFGYWALEIAALVKILDIPDDSFKDHKYYPYDLVHFGG